MSKAGFSTALARLNDSPTSSKRSSHSSTASTASASDMLNALKPKKFIYLHTKVSERCLRLEGVLAQLPNTPENEERRTAIKLAIAKINESLNKREATADDVMKLVTQANAEQAAAARDAYESGSDTSSNSPSSPSTPTSQRRLSA